MCLRDPTAATGSLGAYVWVPLVLGVVFLKSPRFPLPLRVRVPWDVRGVPHACTAIPWGVPAPIHPSGQVPWMSPCSQELPGHKDSGLREHFIPAGRVTWAVPALLLSQGPGSAAQMPCHHGTRRSNPRDPDWFPRSLLIPGECPVPGTLAGSAGAESCAACFRSSRTPSSTC